MGGVSVPNVLLDQPTVLISGPLYHHNLNYLFYFITYNSQRPTPLVFYTLEPLRSLSCPLLPQPTLAPSIFGKWKISSISHLQSLQMRLHPARVKHPRSCLSPSSRMHTILMDAEDLTASIHAACVLQPNKKNGSSEASIGCKNTRAEIREQQYFDWGY